MTGMTLHALHHAHSASFQISAFGSHGFVEANVTFNPWRVHYPVDGAIQTGQSMLQCNLVKHVCLTTSWAST